MHRCPLGRVFRYVSLQQPLPRLWIVLPVVHTVRIHGIYDKKRPVLYGMSALLALQIVVTAICCAFYRCEFYFPL